MGGWKAKSVWDRKTADGPGASETAVRTKWKGAGIFPEFPNPSMITRQLLERGEQSRVRGGRFLGAQLSFRPALRQCVSPVAAFNSDP
jgi:hypothetical protein